MELQLHFLSLASVLAKHSGIACNYFSDENFLNWAENMICSGMQGNLTLNSSILKTLGNVCFERDFRTKVVQRQKLVETAIQLSSSDIENSAPEATLKSIAIRFLAILGMNEEVSLATRRPLVENRGLRVLSLDGGGMKGLATIRLLKHIEKHTQRPLHELFDLVVGT